MDLKSVDLLSLQTKAMQLDTTTQAMCAALTPQMQAAAEEIEKVLILSRVDSLPDEILDELAVQLHVLWYDSEAAIGVKRALIKNSDKVQMYLGTPYAVELVMQDYFGAQSRLKEWFEYSGTPYTFKVVVYNQYVSGSLAEQFSRALSAVKNARSVLDGVIYGLICSETLLCSDSLIII